jgi:hypothetical protein
MQARIIVLKAGVLVTVFTLLPVCFENVVNST